MMTCEVLGTVDPTVMMRLLKYKNISKLFINLLHYQVFLLDINPYQSVLGQDIRVEVTLQVSNALHGHLMYFLPSGGGLMG